MRTLAKQLSIILALGLAATACNKKTEKKLEDKIEGTAAAGTMPFDGGTDPGSDPVPMQNTTSGTGVIPGDGGIPGPTTPFADGGVNHVPGNGSGSNGGTGSGSATPGNPTNPKPNTPPPTTTPGTPAPTAPTTPH